MIFDYPVGFYAYTRHQFSVKYHERTEIALVELSVLVEDVDGHRVGYYVIVSVRRTHLFGLFEHFNGIALVSLHHSVVELQYFRTSIRLAPLGYRQPDGCDVFKLRT